MAKKIKQELLNEELKKFRQLSEYTFYTEQPDDESSELLLGSLSEDDEPIDDSNTAKNDTNSDETQTQDDEMFDVAADDQQEPEVDINTPDINVDAPELQQEPEVDINTPDINVDAPVEDDSVEIDVTQIVKGSEDAKNASLEASDNTSDLLEKFTELEQRVKQMNNLSSKIDTIEKEIIKRNPTPVEKLEMRSFDSYPYNIKLTDFWKDVDGYEATGEEKEKEYVLTKNDIGSDGMNSSIGKSFDVSDDYEEEEI